MTAGLGYGLSDLDPDPAEQALAALAQTDRLMRYDPSSRQWHDAAQDLCPGGSRIPASAASGNSSGVVFADLTGDGWSTPSSTRWTRGWTRMLPAAIPPSTR